MLKTEHRLRKTNEFRSVLRRGIRARGRSIAVYVHHHRSEHSGRPPVVGFVVGRAVGGAVVRNAVRRRLRHLVAARIDRLPDDSAIVVRALPGAAEVPSECLARDFDQTFDRVLARAGTER